MSLGISYTTSFAVYFLTNVLSVSDEQLPSLLSLIGSLSLVEAALGTLVGTIVTDRMRNRTTLVLVSGVLVAADSVIVAFSPSVALFVLGTAVTTFATGLFLPNAGKLLMTVLSADGQHVGKFMAIATIVDQVPRTLGPLVAPAVIALGALTPLGGYPILYRLPMPLRSSVARPCDGSERPLSPHAHPRNQRARPGNQRSRVVNEFPEYELGEWISPTEPDCLGVDRPPYVPTRVFKPQRTRREGSPVRDRARHLRGLPQRVPRGRRGPHSTINQLRPKRCTSSHTT